MKRFFTLLLLSLTLASAPAQNAIFKKYAERDDVDYVCVTRAMLRFGGALSSTTLSVNGVNVAHLAKNLNNILIIDADQPAPMRQMRDDFATLRRDEAYEVLMEARSGGEVTVTLLNRSSTPMEFILYVQDKTDATFIILTGTFSDEDISHLINAD